LSEQADIPVEVLDAVRSVCLALPETSEEQAWTGTRWRIRTRTFAHVLQIASGWPPAYARAAGTTGPATVVMFRSSGIELEALRRAGHPWFAPVWRADEVGLIVEADVDWDDVGELLTESYCLLAPKALAAAVRRPWPHTKSAREPTPDVGSRADFEGGGAPEVTSSRDAVCDDRCGSRRHGEGS
jgi:hypothetical protein